MPESSVFSVIEEHRSLLSALETNQIPPQFVRRAMSVLHDNRNFFDEDMRQRYQALAAAMEPTRRNIAGLFALPEGAPVR